MSNFPKTCHIVMMSPPWVDTSSFTPTVVYIGAGSEKAAEGEKAKNVADPKMQGFNFEVLEVSVIEAPEEIVVG